MSDAADGPQLKPIGDSLFVVWPGWTIEFSRLHDHRESLSAEVSIVDGVLGALHWARLNLASTQARNTLARSLEETGQTRPWRELLERSCRLVVEHLRRGPDGEYLKPVAPNGHQWLVQDRIRLNDITILYGDGGTGKSMLALAFAVYGLLGHRFGWWTIQPVRRVLYLDWETDSSAHQERLYGLTQGLEQIPGDAIFYRRLYRPVAEDISALRADADRHQADLIICDSLGPACGAEPETPGAAVAALMALRSLPGTKLVIAHVSKATADTGQGAKPFGSIYVHNLARSTFFAKATDDDTDSPDLSVTLHHRKSNYGKRTSPSGFKFGFSPEGMITVSGTKADLSVATIPAQILAQLRIGPQTVSMIAEAIEKNEDVVRMQLNRLRTISKVIQLDTVSGGRGHKSQWGLIDRNRINGEP